LRANSPAKADEFAQKAFIKTYKKLKEIAEKMRQLSQKLLLKITKSNFIFYRHIRPISTQLRGCGS
jgi:hypothetical protein